MKQGTQSWCAGTTQRDGVERELVGIEDVETHVHSWLIHVNNIWGKPEKAMATHSSTLAWEIPWTEEPGRLQSVGSLRVGLD